MPFRSNRLRNFPAGPQDWHMAQRLEVETPFHGNLRAKVASSGDARKSALLSQESLLGCRTPMVRNTATPCVSNPWSFRTGTCQPDFCARRLRTGGISLSSRRSVAPANAANTLSAETARLRPVYLAA